MNNRDILSTLRSLGLCPSNIRDKISTLENRERLST